jgi:hypothetical protein
MRIVWGCGKMPILEKSDVMKSVLKTLIAISSRKTDLPYALMTMDDLIKRLEIRYEFLRNIQINDDVYNEETANIISIMSDINTVPPVEMGKALHDIIDSLNRSLGDRAGHFFIKEIRTRLSDDEVSVMKTMGVDLGMLQLESEIARLERDITEKKK